MTATFSPFAPLVEDVRDRPKKACLGYVESVGTPKISASGDYIVQPILIGGTQGAPSKTFVNLLYRPEWLRPGFDSDTLKAADTNTAYQFVYRSNVGGERCERKPTGALSTLAGITGSMENFYQIAGQIQAAIEGVEDENVPETVATVIREFISENAPVVGYVLKQKEEATGEVVNGKKVKAKVDGYEVGYWFFEATESQFIQKQAASGRLVLGFEA